MRVRFIHRHHGESEMTQTKRDLYIKKIFSTVAPHLDFLTSLFSLGLCRLWRRKAVSLARLRPGDRVLDSCTGTGDFILALMKELGPGGRITGIDFCPEMIRIAEQKVRKAPANPHPRKVSFTVADAKALPFNDGTFDLVTVGFGMRNIPDTGAALNEIQRVLKPGGRFVCLELTRPEKQWFLPLYKSYVFRIMPFIGRMVVKKATPYVYLPRSIEAFYPPDRFVQVIRECGFTDVNAHPMTLGVATVFTAVKA